MNTIELFNKQYQYNTQITSKNNHIPLTYWTVTPNFGDLLSPYLIEKLSGSKIELVNLKPGHRRKPFRSQKHKKQFSYFAIGSIASRTNDHSIVWGAGTFGTETAKDLKNDAKYLAVRGPLTRNMIRIHGGKCPEIYGDPALLIPGIYSPQIEKKFEIGIIIRWPEADWASKQVDEKIKIINFGTESIESTLNNILSCEKILSSSLHGIILADAYSIPSAWLASDTPKGLEHKFYDYFLSVNKIQNPQPFDFNTNLISAKKINSKIIFDDRAISFDQHKLLEVCPFLTAI